MLLRTACATSLLALAAPIAAGPSVYGVPDDSRIVRVQCMNGSGSAFRIGRNTYLSVAHVTTQAACYANGKPIEAVRMDGDFTIARVRDNRAGFMRIDCGGFIPGREYIAFGFARGLDGLTAVELVATNMRNDDTVALRGMATVIPGQSGGPIVDKLTGSVVGTVNTYNMQYGISGSVELKSKEVCHA